MAFGFPTMIAFLRYATERRERPALAVLLVSAFFYPSTFIICAPAYGITLLWPWKLDRRWLLRDLNCCHSLVLTTSGEDL